MSTFYLYLYAKDSDETGFAARAFEILRTRGFATKLDGDEILFDEENEDAMLLAGQGGNWIRRSEVPVAIPEESHSYAGICPKCSGALGEDFDLLWDSSLHPELFSSDEGPGKVEHVQVVCPECRWTGGLEDCKLEGEDFSIRLRREYLAVYDIHDTDIHAWKDRLEAMVPGSEVIISVD